MFALQKDAASLTPHKEGRTSKISLLHQRLYSSVLLSDQYRYCTTALCLGISALHMCPDELFVELFATDTYFALPLCRKEELYCLQLISDLHCFC